MKTLKKILILALFLPFVQDTLYAKVRIVTTLTVLKYIAEQVGGNRVEVESLLPGDVDPHFADARPDYILKLNRADMIVYIGMDLEVGWLPKLIEQSRNPKLYTGKPGNCDVSVGITPLEKPTSPVDRSMGDIHIYGNPHYWLDPLNAVIIARNIKDSLVKIDPDSRDYYETQYLNFATRMKNFTLQKLKEYEQLKGLKVAVHHREFIYLFHRFGITEVTSLEEKPGVPPSASYLNKVAETLKKENVRLILIAPYNDPRYAKFVSEKTNIKYVVVPTNISGNIDTYEKIIQTILETIKNNT